MTTIECEGEDDIRGNNGNEVVANDEQLATASSSVMGNKKPTLMKDISTFVATCQYLFLISIHNWESGREMGTVLRSICQCLFT